VRSRSRAAEALAGSAIGGGRGGSE
jgi:hypothetical protein